MILRFEGATPDEDEQAAIHAALKQVDAAVATPEKRSAWKLSTQFPEATVDELRLMARTERDVF